MLSTLLGTEDGTANKTDMVSILRISQEGESKPQNSKCIQVFVIKTMKKQRQGRDREQYEGSL